MTSEELEQRSIAFLEEKLDGRPAVAALSEGSRARLLEKASLRWKGRIGARIAERLSPRQTVEFKKAIAAGDDQWSRRCLEQFVPDSDDLVLIELEKILDEVEQSAVTVLDLERASGARPQL